MNEKTIPFYATELGHFLTTLNGYWIERAQAKNLSTAQVYELYILKQFYEKLRKRHDQMIVGNKKVVKVKFDRVLATLVTNVLQRCKATLINNNILFHLGSMIALTQTFPPQTMRYGKQ